MRLATAKNWGTQWDVRLVVSKNGEFEIAFAYKSKEYESISKPATLAQLEQLARELNLQLKR